MGVYAGATISVSETETRDSQKRTGDRPNGHAFGVKYIAFKQPIFSTVAINVCPQFC